jgi:hypothetical protein
MTEATTFTDSDGVTWSLKPQEIEFLIKRAYDSEVPLLRDTKGDSHLNRDGHPWILDFEKKELNLKVYSSQTKTSIKRFKAVCLVPNISPQDFLACISDGKSRSTWDRNMKGFTTMYIQEGSTKVSIFRSATKQIG